MDWIEIKNEKPAAEGLYLVEGHYVTDIREDDEDFLLNTSLFRGYRVAYWDGERWWSEDYVNYYEITHIVTRWHREPISLFVFNKERLAACLHP